MAEDCSSLVANVNQTFNYTLSDVWLDEKWNGVMSAKFFQLPSFVVGLIMILFGIPIIPYLIVYLYYPKYDKAQKWLRLQQVDVGTILRSDAKTLLSSYVDEVHIIEYILDYANIVLEDSDLEKVSSSHIDGQPFGQLLLKKRLILYTLIVTLLVWPYIAYYQTFIHIHDSYKSYVETQCAVVANTTQCVEHESSDDSRCRVYRALYDVDMAPVCDHDSIDMNEYRFLSRLEANSWNDTSNPCWIHKQEFTLRLTATNSRRSGLCCQFKEAGRCSENGCCCYFVLLLCATFILLVALYLFWAQLHSDLTLGYTVKTIFDLQALQEHFTLNLHKLH